MGSLGMGMYLRRGAPASSVGIKTSAGNKHGMCQASQKRAEKREFSGVTGRQHLSKYLHCDRVFPCFASNCKFQIPRYVSKELQY
jgi:hypothetical protein